VEGSMIFDSGHPITDMVASKVNVWKENLIRAS
jgi:hypothetical protein